MKFRGKIIDIACLNHFTRVVTTISKLTKTCVLRLTLDNLFFILSGKVTNGGVSMWCELLQPTLSSISRIVTHDVPVDVIPRRLWQELKEPSMPDFDVSIYLPPLKTMKNVVDRMKNLSNFLVVEANLNGEMNLKIETDLVSATTHFKDLGNPPWGDESSQDGGPSQSRDPELMAEATVDIRKLQQFLVGQQVNPSKAMCNIVHQNVVHLILLHEDVSLQYFIPAVA
ncbi:checkpoint protein HUS1 isoform X2 [Girardinichthys multiradiatus]|uniref:checkpoint protein HUS1 isoform X2 n=1 Tax=Girardinichthys multiradiatus TaxID=208333 RepID=UPI001FABADAD|nr:checkpoint protein HUS1 isoform X2 [Girardinichthys multiradiatus]